MARQASIGWRSWLKADLQHVAASQPRQHSQSNRHTCNGAVCLSSSNESQACRVIRHSWEWLWCIGNVSLQALPNAR